MSAVLVAAGMDRLCVAQGAAGKASRVGAGVHSQRVG